MSEGFIFMMFMLYVVYMCIIGNIQMTEKKLTKEEKISCMLVFIKAHSDREIAKFILNQDDTIEGIRNNYNEFKEAYGKLLQTKGKKRK